MLFGFFLLHVVVDHHWLAQLHVAVEASHLQLAHVVLGLAHHMRHALSRACTSGAVRNDHVFGRAEDGCLTAQGRVKVNLLECSASQAQVEQHALMLWPVFGHAVNQLVIHVRANTLGGFFFELVDCTDDLRLHWALSREGFDDGFRLESDGSFCQQCGEHAASASPWLGALFILHAKNIKAFDEHLNPVFARVDVRINFSHEVGAKLLQLAFVHVFGQVGIKRWLFHVAAGHQVDLKTVKTDHHVIGVLDHDLHRRGVILHHVGQIQTHRGLRNRRNDAHISALIECGFAPEGRWLVLCIGF